MTGGTTHSVRIEWKGSFSLAKVLGLDNENKDYGLYQIWGHHIVYGADSLLYIERYNGRFLKVVNTGKYGSLQRKYMNSNRKR